MAAIRPTVFVADELPIFAEGLVHAISLRKELEPVGSAHDGGDALEWILELRPDLALLGLRLPGMGGLEVLDRLRELGRGTRVAISSAVVDGEAVYAALARGAVGYLAKTATGDELCEALAEVARGGVVISPQAQASLANGIHSRETQPRSPLTGREHQVLRLIADGMTVPEIGRRLHLSTSTVKSHVQSLYGKLGVGDRAAAVAVGMRSGLLR